MPTEALAVIEPINMTARHRDRRNTWGALLTHLTRTMAETGDPALLRGAFETALRRMLSIESVELRDRHARFARRRSEGVAESIALDVPVSGGAGVLEAVLRPGAPIGEWDLQVLGASAHLAGLILELERSRLRNPRNGLGSPVRQSRDGAAPLIGRTPAVLALRSQIERVSSTDFTVLLEGARSPQ